MGKRQAQDPLNTPLVDTDNDVCEFVVLICILYYVTYHNTCITDTPNTAFNRTSWIEFNGSYLWYHGMKNFVTSKALRIKQNERDNASDNCTINHSIHNKQGAKFQRNRLRYLYSNCNMKWINNKTLIYQAIVLMIDKLNKTGET